MIGGKALQLDDSVVHGEIVDCPASPIYVFVTGHFFLRPEQLAVEFSSRGEIRISSEGDCANGAVVQSSVDKKRI